MRTAFTRNLAELARKDKRTVLVTVDMGFSVLEEFMKEFPDRSFNTGIAEQNAIGIASGLALSGKIPYVYSITPFVTMRPFEQVRIDVCYQNLPVKLVGSGGGLTYGQLGPTHHSIEDIAIMRALPNMSVMCPGDPHEAEACILASHELAGPAYIRLGKGSGDPVVHKTNPKIRFGKGIVVREGKDITLVATGNILHNALLASEELSKKGVNAGVVSIPFVKPLDNGLILSLSEKPILSVEEHSIIGGLGSAISEVLSEGGAKAKFARHGLPDKFVSEVGSQTHLRKLHSLDPEGIARRAMSLIK